MHIPWPEIESFHNIRKYSYSHPEILKGQSKVIYKCKVKLHGTNSAIQWTPEGDIVCQSRSNIITPENDNAGFARWVKENEAELKKFSFNSGFIVYGEWCGPGIQKGVAISQIPNRVFAIFALRPMNSNNDTLLVEPSQIAQFIGDLKVPGMHILPWYGSPINIDWAKLPTEFVNETTIINQWVESIETNDPWVEQTFGVKGTGEGLVLYPVSEAHQGYNAFKDLVFKAKGEKHKNVKTAAPAQVNPETAASVGAFVEMVLTPARLEQGARAILGEHKHEDKLSCLFCTTSEVQFDMKLTGKFVSWCLADVQKETTDELEASGLDWKQVQKPLTDKARSWYLEQAKK